MTVTPIRKIQVGENAHSMAVLNRDTEDVLTGSNYLADGTDFAGFLSAPALSGEIGTLNTLFPVGHVHRYGAIGNGVIDDTTAWNNAAASMRALGGGVVYGFPGKTYGVTSINNASKVTLDFTGIFLTRLSGSATTSVVMQTGALTATTTALSANAAIGDQSVTVSSSAGFAVDDWVLVFDLTYKYSTAGRNEELQRIIEITDATHIKFASRLIGSYATASTATVTKASVIERAVVKGGTITIPVGVSGGGILGILNVDCLVDGVTIIGPAERAGVRWDESLRCRATKCLIRDGQNQSVSANGYAFSLNESCLGCTIDFNHTVNMRESMFTNNTRYCNFVDNLLEANYDSGFNTHGSGCEHITIARNTVIGSRNPGIIAGWLGSPSFDTDITIEDNTVSGTLGHGIYAIGSAAGANRGARIHIKNNRVSLWGRATVSSYAAIYVQYVDEFTVEDNKITGDVSSFAWAGIWLVNATKGVVNLNKISKQSPYCIRFENACDDVVFEDNWTVNSGAAWNINHVVATPSTNIVIRNNKFDSDSTHRNLAGTERVEGNKWATKYDRTWGATSVADGGTITHGCVVAPTTVRVTPSIASQMVSVTAISATTFTVAIKTDAGGVGTTQTVYWEAVA